jgi:hypothetical protein
MEALSLYTECSAIAYHSTYPNLFASVSLYNLLLLFASISLYTFRYIPKFGIYPIGHSIPIPTSIFYTRSVLSIPEVTVGHHDMS